MNRNLLIGGGILVAAVIAVMGFINMIGNDGSVRGPIPGFTEKAIAAPAEAVPATPASQPNVAPVAPQTTPAPAATVAAPGTTVNVIVNCCPEKVSAPKAEKPKAKKVVKKKPAVVTPAPVAEAIGRFEKKVGPCG